MNFFCNNFIYNIKKTRISKNIHIISNRKNDQDIIEYIQKY
jgi:hypothetical protein